MRIFVCNFVYYISLIKEIEPGIYFKINVKIEIVISELIVNQ